MMRLQRRGFLPWRCQGPLLAGGEPGGAPTMARTVQLDAAALGVLRELDPLGHSHLIERVFTAFEASLSRMLPQLADAGRSGDLHAIRHIAHTLKSSAATVGALAMSRQCAEIETMVREQRGDALAPRIEELLTEVAGVRAALLAVPERAR